MYQKILIGILLLISTVGGIFAKTVDIYAHRGFRPLAPENTLVAYTDALKIGVDALDMDINMTKDHILVVTHDLTLNPALTKDKDGHWIKQPIPIKSLTLKQLETYTVGEIKPGSDLAKMYPHHLSIKNVHIPTLLEVINYVKTTVDDRVRLQIEIKTNPYEPKLSYSAKEMAKALDKVLRQTNTSSMAEVQAFEWSALTELQKLNPKVETAYLTDHTTEPMSAKEDKQPNKINKWTYPLQPSKYNYDYPIMVHKLGGDLWEPYENDLTKKALDQAHLLGLRVVTWSWTEAEGKDFNYKTIEKLIDWGVDGIITDRPDILRGIEAAKGLNLPAAYPNTPYPQKY
ncbi:glycerophosphodiester phosphodiesterase [Facilibium subflavum]|uniref:glycerophosphodiester phosphodiesterase n=1 Tax=Facilibium subflavum TaxID=2219058 RepID=UPI000E658BF3|nr:glycerophosphodiester phosphodiesterase [Facilibium subflavum]